MTATIDIGGNEAVARAQARAFVDAQKARRSLMDFVPWASPRYARPNHLAPLVRLIERTERGERVLAVVSAPPRHGKPLGQDTLVTMGDGSLRRIAELHVGDRVVSGMGRVTTVTAVFDQGVLDVSEVTTLAGRRFLAEASHRFLTRDGWKRVDQLRAYRKTNWQRPRGDQLLAGAQYATDSTSIGIETARFLGYMCGDGNSTQHNCRWTNVDRGVREEFSRVVRALGGEVVPHDAQTLGVLTAQRPMTAEQKRARHAEYERARRAGGKLESIRHRHHLRDLLAVHGLLGKKAADKRMPSSILTAPMEEVAAFIAALFECDGTRGAAAGTRGSNASISSVSRGLLLDCQHLLARFGIRSSVIRKRGRYNGELHVSWSLTILDQARFFEVMPIHGAKAGPCERSRRHERDRHLPDTVVSIEPAGREHCYCITVAHDESFLAEGLVTHNTETEVHAIAWALKRDPTKQLAFIGYAARFAEKKSRKAREIAKQIGVPLADDSSSKQDWRTGVGDGGLWATSIGGQLTGEGFHCMYIDDPVKDRRTAESRVYRDHIYDWFNDTAFTRLEPRGSCIVTQTRWHVDDLAGRLIRDGWEHVQLPAINDNGEALWPERWPVERLRRIQTKLGEYGWSSLYQGRPFPRGGKVFRDACFYEGLLEAGFRISIGADFAYSEKSRADYSTIVVLAEFEGDFYVLDVYREQVESPKHAAALRLQQLRYGVPVHAYIAGTELGVVSFMAQAGVRIRVLPARGDKFSRAQPVAAAWNNKKVLLPVDAPWLDDFLVELGDFTGVRDAHDDLVDALAAAFDALERPEAEADVTLISA